MQIRCTQADHRNQQIIGFCIDSTCQNQRPYCNFCLPRHSQHLEMLTSIELLYEWIKQGIIKIKDFEKNVQEFKVALDSLNDMFLPYLNFNIQRFPQLGISEIDKLIKDLCEIEDYEKNLYKQLMQSIEQGKSIVNEIRRKKKNQSNFEQNNHLQIRNFKIEKLLLDIPCVLKPFSYELIKENSIKQNDNCFAIALNKNCQILAASCGKQIKIYEFEQGKLKLQQVLNEHRKWVSTLNFMKKQNQLISGDGDGSIIFWSKNNNNQWDYSQIIKAHNDSIRCLILNTNEDMIVSSGGDNTIKFWIKQNEWICQQIITNHNSCVCQLSLNDQENIVISCGMDKQILVIQYSQQDQKWIVIDNIKTKSYGDRICFINNQYFAFQPSRGEQIHIYELNSVNNKFDRKKDIFLNEGNDMCGLFPQQFIKSKQLLLNKHHQYIYLIRKTQNDEFKIEQSIEFSSTSINGYMSEDGEYLITWDDSSKEIQIRKYQEK